jgi:hypothetical protein
MGARHIDWLQLSPGRHVCQFETKQPPLTQLQKISRRWATLTFLLDFENEGLGQSQSGRCRTLRDWLLTVDLIAGANQRPKHQ